MRYKFSVVVDFEECIEADNAEEAYKKAEVIQHEIILSDDRIACLDIQVQERNV